MIRVGIKENDKMPSIREANFFPKGQRDSPADANHHIIFFFVMS